MLRVLGLLQSFVRIGCYRFVERSVLFFLSLVALKKKKKEKETEKKWIVTLRLTRRDYTVSIDNMYKTVLMETELTYNPWNDIYVKELPRRFYLWIKNNVIIFLHKKRLFFASLLFDVFIKKEKRNRKTDKKE